MRDYRKGNWTVSETMILIEAKKMDDERRIIKRISGPRSGSGGGGGGDQNAQDQSSCSRGKQPAELRWKWVEDYCWRKGCMRSQNQCNDKWDNLMRDYKKVRDYEKRIVEEEGSSSAHSYWKIEKNERKERNLPTNMLPQIYEALVEVVEKKLAHHQRLNLMALTTTTTTSSSFAVVAGTTSSSLKVFSYVHHHHHELPPLIPPPSMLQQHHISAAPPSMAAAAALPLPSPPEIAATPPLIPTTTQPLALPSSHPFPTVGTLS